MDLQQEIDAKRAEIRTDEYAMSIGEWISLYENKELDIHPEFQSFFRLDIWQKSRLIESILLGIPIPPAFVSQRKDGVWDVVDGLQRLSTIFQFVGILKNAKGDLELPLVLEKTEYLPSLKGVVWHADNISRIEDKNPHLKALTPTQRLLIRRAKIHVIIILKENNGNSQYDLFQRLNNSGSSLSGQELRNGILISLNQDMYKWLKQLSTDENFTSCVNLTDKAINEQYDIELVLRFLIFRNIDNTMLNNIGNIDDFLTESMCTIATSQEFDKEKEDKYFKETFALLAKNAKGDSFRRYDTVKGRFVGGFLTSAFEAIALGIGYDLDRINNQQVNIEQKIKQLWQMQEFIESVGLGIYSSTRTLKVVPLGRDLFKP